MKKLCPARFRVALIAGTPLLFFHQSGILTAEPAPSAISAFNSYTQAVELRLARQHRAPDTFLAHSVTSYGEPIVENLTPSRADFPGALLHHWRGTAFVAGAKAAAFELLLRDVSSWPQTFSPEVLKAAVVAQSGDRMEVWMRVRQRHVITVVTDTTCDISFGRLDPRHGYSISRSTRVAEIDSPRAGAERALDAGEEHGFLWRLNTYWSYEERDGGLYLQIESVSLSRSIPPGLGWVIRPYVESIPRESLEFTLHAASKYLRIPQGQRKL